MTDEPRGSYAESREKQAEFEELLREEDDWQDAVDDVVEGNEPEEVDTPASNTM